jgi:hypothetical protein
VASQADQPVARPPSLRGRAVADPLRSAIRGNVETHSSRDPEQVAQTSFRAAACLIATPATHLSCARISGLGAAWWGHRRRGQRLRRRIRAKRASQGPRTKYRGTSEAGLVNAGGSAAQLIPKKGAVKRYRCVSIEAQPVAPFTCLTLLIALRCARDSVTLGGGMRREHPPALVDYVQVA